MKVYEVFTGTEEWTWRGEDSISQGLFSTKELAKEFVRKYNSYQDSIEKMVIAPVNLDEKVDWIPRPCWKARIYLESGEIRRLPRLTNEHTYDFGDPNIKGISDPYDCSQLKFEYQCIWVTSFVSLKHAEELAKKARAHALDIRNKYDVAVKTMTHEEYNRIYIEPTTKVYYDTD